MTNDSNVSHIHNELSLNLWKRINAGYIKPVRPPQSSTHATYVYDPKLIEKASTEFHRKRDFYTDYNETAARFKLVLGNKKPLQRKNSSKLGRGRNRSPSSSGKGKNLDSRQLQDNAQGSLETGNEIKPLNSSTTEGDTVAPAVQSANDHVSSEPPDTEDSLEKTSVT